MIFITKNIKMKEQKLLGKAYHFKKYLCTTVWFLFIPVYSKQSLLQQPKQEFNYDVENTPSPVYVPSKDEKRVLEGKDEVSFE